MSHHKAARSNWIGPFVKKLDLPEKEPVADLNRFRIRLEECQLTERIQQTLVAVNKQAGYQAVYLLEFLPPQRSVVRLSFSKDKTEYIMEIVLRSSGPAVVFHSVNRGSWERYLRGFSRSFGSRIAFNQTFKPEEITNGTIRVWFSFLLSGFERKFNPGMYKQSEIVDFGSGGFFDKASA